MQYSLSNEDILKLLDGKCNIMTYPELVRFNDINDILGPYGVCVILYETKHNYGHWCCITRHKSSLEFFDSYGLRPDDGLKFIPEHFRDMNNERLPHLTVLLYLSGLPIEYNNKTLQGDGVTTCGRHVVCRIWFKKVPVDRYANIMLHEPITPDEIVTDLTSRVLGT